MIQKENKENNISIIIPTYNEYNNLKDLLNLINSIDADQIKETIVVDAQASNDNARALVMDLGANYFQSMHTNRAIQMNEGAKQAKGDILYFIHADVRPPQQFTGDILASISRKNQFGFFRYRFDSEKRILKFNSLFTHFNNIFVGGGDQTLFIEAKTFHEVGGFDESLALCEDFDLFKRLKKNKVQFEIVKSMVTISDRKYLKNNYLKVNFTNLVVFTLFQCGYDSKKLKVFYQKILN